jgi:hypothetical protein
MCPRRILVFFRAPGGSEMIIRNWRCARNSPFRRRAGAPRSGPRGCRIPRHGRAASGPRRPAVRRCPELEMNDHGFASLAAFFEPWRQITAGGPQSSGPSSRHSGRRCARRIPWPELRHSDRRGQVRSGLGPQPASLGLTPAALPQNPCGPGCCRQSRCGSDWSDRYRCVAHQSPRRAAGIRPTPRSWDRTGRSCRPAAR